MAAVRMCGKVLWQASGFYPRLVFARLFIDASLTACVQIFEGFALEQVNIRRHCPNKTI